MDIQVLKDTIGHKLKVAREEGQYSQQDIATKLKLSKVGYGSYERGQNLISLNQLIAVARILDKPITYFLPPLISDREMNDAQHDPLLRRLLDAWPQLSPRLRKSLVDLVEHTISHKNAP